MVGLRSEGLSPVVLVSKSIGCGGAPMELLPPIEIRASRAKLMHSRKKDGTPVRGSIHVHAHAPTSRSVSALPAAGGSAVTKASLKSEAQPKWKTSGTDAKPLTYAV